MQRTVEHVIVVLEIECDRCGLRARRTAEGSEFGRMTSIGFRAEEGSIFGPGQRVQIDLCERCLRSALGAWLRVWNSADAEAGAGLASKLATFDSGRHGGEFPARDAQGLDDVFRSLALADAEEAVAEAPPPAQASALDASWVPVSELFNRLADGEALGLILAAFPQISRHAARHALREAALRFPPYACFHASVDVWTPRYPHER